MCTQQIQVRNQSSALSTQYSVLSTQYSVLSTQRSALRPPRTDFPDVHTGTRQRINLLKVPISPRIRPDTVRGVLPTHGSGRSGLKISRSVPAVGRFCFLSVSPSLRLSVPASGFAPSWLRRSVASWLEFGPSCL